MGNPVTHSLWSEKKKKKWKKTKKKERKNLRKMQHTNWNRFFFSFVRKFDVYNLREHNNTYVCTIVELFINGYNTTEFNILIGHELILYIGYGHQLRILWIICELKKCLSGLAAGQKCGQHHWNNHKTKTIHFTFRCFFSLLQHTIFLYNAKCMRSQSHIQKSIVWIREKTSCRIVFSVSSGWDFYSVPRHLLFCKAFFLNVYFV